MKSRVDIFVLLAGLLICISSCRQNIDVCLQSKSNPCVIGFYLYLEDTLGDFKKTALELQSASIYLETGMGVDTLFHNEVISTASIPLNPNEDSLRIYLRSDSLQAVADTLVFIYERQDIFIDMACGLALTYTLDTVYSDRQFIDSSNITNSNLILNNSDENVQIIY